MPLIHNLINNMVHFGATNINLLKLVIFVPLVTSHVDQIIMCHGLNITITFVSFITNVVHNNYL